MIQNGWIKKEKINGLETYIVSPEWHFALLNDKDFLTEIGISKDVVMQTIRMIQQVKCFDLFLAFVHNERRKRYPWFPAVCWKFEENYYHVFCRNTWMCRNCGYVLSADILMPMCEADTTFYALTEQEYPDIPPMFKKIKCINCGQNLQNHLIVKK